ncbi:MULTISPECIES: 5-dehydro-4-deoxy-D-glucuronate isomerase [Asticcacaulis]|uniref:5-dehydro-4-deoxy-D-glucuronate isomerase n=1 Tax=Asticcacaulis TaxID=76890 RepID=UPI001AE4E838|nr:MULTISPECIES: 5-dehydro-4-deoxy-D-glucuronate isomerase [Asticcacaulis]
MYDRVFYATHPDEVMNASQNNLRDRYLITDLFRDGHVSLNYVHQERLVIGGVLAGLAPVELPPHDAPDSLAGQSFLANREMAVVNVGANAGLVEVDGVHYRLDSKDALYISRGVGRVSFRAVEANAPVRYYLASTPAHQSFDTKLIPIKSGNPLKRGSLETANSRTIHQLVVPGVCRSAQLLVGLTILEPGSVWNTMPPHLHDRRSEVYFYFDLPETARVFHFMGKPAEMRHLVAGNEQGVICPPWSIHAGCGTEPYAFIWAMGGENLDYNDMDALDICQLS